MASVPFLRFLLPMENPLGFGAADFVELALAAILVALLLARGPIVTFARRIAGRTAVCMALLGALPVVLRLGLLANHPVPTPTVADDFSYLLLGDTLAHLRLANATHPLHRFFEAVFVVQEPSYSSIYPLGQGLALAFGEVVFRLPWAGVLLSEGLLCAGCYWMLRGWIDPLWALAGGVLAALEFGPMSPWMNSYWGGAVSGVAGCLVFGALPRLRGALQDKRRRTREAVLLGIGLGLQLLTRPFEFAVLCAVVLLFLLPARTLVIATLALAPAVGLTLLQNKQVTGSWTQLPYQLSRYQYGVPATFTFQPNPVPHRPLSVEQQVDYETQVAVHGKDVDTFRTYFARLGERVRFYRFFFLAPLYLALAAFLPALRQYRFVVVSIALALFWLADAFYPYFYPHYIAAATCLFVLVSVKGLEQLSRLKIRGFSVGEEAAALILILCFGHFVFWYGNYLAGNASLPMAMNGHESWDSVNSGSSDARIDINDRLARAPGKQLVFVRYSAAHGASEWIRNAADIDDSRVVWAIDLGAEDDAVLRGYYPDRQVWLMEPDARPPRLVPFEKSE
jgi:hypothetical protein